MIQKNQIQQLAKQYAPFAKEIRHYLHQNPELSFEEYNTQKYIHNQLINIGITEIKTLANTGIVALIKGKNPDSKTIALRADMDALPIQEQNNVAYKSINEGVMHACGHDVHSACLLAAAAVLFQLKEHWEGTIKLIFQPGEEKLPGGASKMISEGVLKTPTVNTIIGQHVMPSLSVGKVGFRSGLYMASTDEIYITIIGKGGHGAMPHMNIDPVLISAQLIVALQQLVSRWNNPTIPCVLSFGKVIANGATNVIPNEVKIEGTFRTMNEEWRNEAKLRMKKLAEELVSGMGGTCEFTIVHGYPYLQNDESVTNRAKEAAQEYLGKDNVVDLEMRMTAEDFAFYSQEIPSTFYRLGTRNESKNITSEVHTPTFDIDEDALEIGIGVMAWMAINECKELA